MDAGIYRLLGHFTLRPSRGQDNSSGQIDLHAAVSNMRSVRVVGHDPRPGSERELSDERALGRLVRPNPVLARPHGSRPHRRIMGLQDSTSDPSHYSCSVSIVRMSCQSATPQSKLTLPALISSSLGILPSLSNSAAFETYGSRPIDATVVIWPSFLAW